MTSFLATPVFIIIALVCASCTRAFVLPGSTFSMRHIASAVHMNRGVKNKAEIGLSSKGKFRLLRSALQNVSYLQVAAQEKEMELQLYCQGNTDLTQITDCPQTHFLQMVLKYKGIRYSQQLVSSIQIPASLSTLGYNGVLPVLVYKNSTVVSHTLRIAQFLEERYLNSPSLCWPGIASCKSILSKTSQFYPALECFILCESPDGSLEHTRKREALVRQIEVLDDVLRSTPGPYFCGIELTYVDLYLAPILYHAMVTLRHFKGIELYHASHGTPRTALEQFMKRLFSAHIFNEKGVYSNVDKIVNGWKMKREQHQKKQQEKQHTVTDPIN